MNPYHHDHRRDRPNRHASRYAHPHYHRPSHGGQPNHPSSGQRPIDELERKFHLSVAIDPTPRMRLEEGSREMTMRAMDLICPIGMGQRGLIVAPPGSGKTTILKHICQSISKSHPQNVKIYVLLIDERPEEVTDFRRSVTAEVRWSSCDESYDHHIATARELMRQVYREVTDGGNVVLLIDSLTRLARVHNAEQRSSGRTLSGGMDARSLEFPRRLFGSARKIEHGGSLTILATILVDTGSRMDQVIFEEFKGTGNMEVYLSREISNRRIFPAIDISKSRTRKEELLIPADEIERIRKIRRVLADFQPVEAIKALVEQLQKHPTNKDLLAIVGQKM